MPTTPPPPARRLDVAAVDAALRRMARAPAPPWLHAEVARRMAERLGWIRMQPQRIVDWWSFLGAGGELLDRAYPKARRVVVEPTAGLVERSAALHRPRWWSARRVEVHGEGETIDGGAQLVWANMMLHAVRNPPALLAHWESLLAADGFVMFSCLGPGSLRGLADLYARLGWPEPMAGFVDMHDLGDMLVHAGFADPVMDQETLVLTWADAAALLAELRGLGANASPDRPAGLRTPRWKARLADALGGLAGPDGRLRLELEVAYGHAFKAAPRMRADAPTTVSLDDMRALVRAGRRHD